MDLLIGFSIGSVLSVLLGVIIFKVMTKVYADKFKVLAREILQENSGQLKEQAQADKEYLDKLHLSDVKDRESLREKINFVMESAHRIEKEASQLTSALSSDVKFQGAWGELTLERILELSGLQKNIEYFTQEVLTDDQGNTKRPDVIIKLPGDASLVIDSKVSLSAYFDYSNSQNKSSALKELKKSIQNHIDSLSKKNYHELLNLRSPDFVYLFIPVEGVYSLILKEYPQIIDESLRKNIILVSPINIIANLKTVASLWRLEKQSKNVDEVARKAGAMYDKFVAIIDDFNKVGVNLSRATESHAELMKKLSEGKGNLVGRAQELKDLGAKTTKSI